MITCTFRGMEAMKRQLKMLPDDLQKRAVRLALQDSARIVAIEASRQAPARKHTSERMRSRMKTKAYTPLKRGIGISAGKKHKIAKTLGGVKDSRFLMTEIVGLKKGAAHGVPVHYGHKHIGYRGRGKWGPTGLQVPPNKFMERAFNLHARRMMRLFESYIQARIRIFSKAGRGLMP